MMEVGSRGDQRVELISDLSRVRIADKIVKMKLPVDKTTCNSYVEQRPKAKQKSTRGKKEKTIIDDDAMESSRNALGGIHQSRSHDHHWQRC